MIAPPVPPSPLPPAKPAAAAPPAAKPIAATGGLSPADYMTEQEKDAANSARQPYPVGDPPPPSEMVIRGQGIKGVTDQPTVAPAEVKGRK